MISNKVPQEKFNELRRLAEKMLAVKGKPTEKVFDGNLLKLIHELQIFQIELEMQNEELNRSQQELMKSKMLYTELYDFAPVGYLTVNKKGLIQKANLTFADMLSAERASLINQRLSSHIALEDQDIYYRHQQNLCDSNRRQICELRLQKKEGTLFDVQLESVTIPAGYDTPKRYRTVVIDITHRKQIEVALKYSNLQLKSILNSIDSSIYISDMKSNKILFMNKYMEKKFNKNLSGSICWQAIREDQDGPCEFCKNNPLINTDGNPSEPYIRDFYYKEHDKWVELHYVAIPWTDGTLVRLGMVTDITDRKTQELEQKRINMLLEDKVKERTAELEDMNAALRVLLKNREEESNKIEEKIFANHKLLLSPIINNLKKTLTLKSQQELIDLLEIELKNILSPFSIKLSDKMINLTPTEIHVADLIRFGKSSKEISEIMNTAVSTISRHRENIRKKTDLKNKKINLSTFLSTLR